MRKIAVIDCETDPFKKGRIPAPFIWGFYDGEHYFDTPNVSEIVDYCRERELIVYAHNGGKFDFHFMLDYLQPFDEDIFIINGRLVKFRIGICEFRDSYAILPTALKAFEKMEFDYTKLEKRNRQKHLDDIKKYLKSDCENLYNMVSAFIKKYGCHLTQASAALKTWEKMTKRKAPKSDNEYFDFFKPYYHGGRVECFKTGIIDTDFKVYDINSAYPFAMLQHHPISTEYYEVEPDLNEIIPHGFYKLNAIAKGCFPFKNKKGELTFPNDENRREYHVTGWELKTAIETETATDIEIIEAYQHFETTNFHDYITHFYEKRNQAKATGDKEENLFCKLLMNSLYGKFGSNPDNYCKYVICPPENLITLDRCGYSIGGELGKWILGQRELETTEMRFYNVATSASITGFVRAYLFKALYYSKNPLYCDTDSIACEFADLSEGDELGQWKCEGEFDRAGIAGKKLYIFRGKKQEGKQREYKKASKGAKLKNNDLWKIAKGGEVLFKPENPVFSLKKSPHFVNRVIRSTNK